MTRFLAILAALTCAASGQTYRTVTAETNNAIRTNFSLVRSQISDLSGASFAISNVSGLQTALDAKIATNGSAAGLTNFPALLLTTNSAASAFPSALLRTNGDGSGLTNLPNANLSNAVGVLPLSNGGTGSTNASNARTALGLGSAATNPATAFQPASTALTNLAAGDAGGLTNLPNANLGTATGVLGIANGGSAATNAAAARTNFGLAWNGLTNADAEGFRTALSLGTAATNDASTFQPASATLTNLANNNGGSLTNVSVDLTTVLPAYNNNAGKVLSVATGATNVEWIAVSNTVTDASSLTNWPSYILQTNSSNASFPSLLLRTNGSAAGLTSFPTLNQNTTGTASNVTGVVAIANGGSGASNTTNARINLLPSYTGQEGRVLAVNSNATDVIWAADGGGTVNLGSTNVTGTLPLARGGTGGTNHATAFANLGVYANGAVIFNGTGNPNDVSSCVVIGFEATNFHNGGHVLLGHSTKTRFVESGIFQPSSIAIGRYAETTNHAIAIGRSAYAQGNNSIAFGQYSRATNSIQIGSGTNGTSDTIQFVSAGTVNTTEWGYLASASTAGGYRLTNTGGVTTNISVTGTNNTNTLVFSNGILVEVQ